MYVNNLLIYQIIENRNKIGYMEVGIGDCGLGIWPNPQSPIPNPQSPIPNPQSPKQQKRKCLSNNSSYSSIK